MKVLSLLLLGLCSIIGLHAQQKTPDFLGQVFTVSASGEADHPLERERSKLKTKVVAYSARNYVEIPGQSSPNVISVSGDSVKLIVAGIPGTDPYEFIHLVRLKKKRGNRLFSTQTVTLRNIDYDAEDRIEFDATPYGIRSSLISFPHPGPGEYGIYYNTPVPRISTFSIPDDATNKANSQYSRDDVY